MYEKILSHLNYLLNNYPNEAKKYLDKRCSQSNFVFGYFPKNINLITDFISIQELKDLKLIRSQESHSHISYNNYFDNYELIIGFKDLYGKVISLIGRTLQDHKELNISKYKNTQYKKSKHLFGLYESLPYIKENDYIIFTEGQFDVIKAFDKNIRNIVAVGSSNISQDQFLLANRFTNNIYLALDNDDAGKIGSERFIAKYGNYCNVKFLNFPKEYKDVDEFLTNNSKEDFENLL